MNDVVPSFYSHWIKAEVFGPELPDENGAFNCGSCFMLRPHGLTRDLGPFRSHLKCCTYSPFLPAFSIGSLLENAESEPRLKEALNDLFRTSNLTPWGAIPKRTRGTSVCETGRHDSDACVFLSRDGQAQCTIRSHRPAVCASYVCRSHNGALGLAQWRKFEAELSAWENTLGTLIALEAGFTLDDVSFTFGTFEEATRYYRRAYKLALEISPDDIGALDR